MKFTLKNIPLAYDGGSVGCKEYALKMEEWFEGFEKQLREELERAINISKETDSDLWREGERFLIAYIKEILGE